MKICNGCNTEKPYIEFSIDSKGKSKDGYQYRCKQCNREYNKLNRERKLPYNIKYNHDNKNKIAKWHSDNKQHLSEYQKQIHNSLGAGVYKITNKILNKYYIGCSKIIYNRKCTWYSILSDPKLPLHLDLLIYGKDAFEFEIIEHCSKDEMFAFETYHIQQYNPNQLYNVNKVEKKEK